MHFLAAVAEQLPALSAQVANTTASGSGVITVQELECMNSQELHISSVKLQTSTSV